MYIILVNLCSIVLGVVLSVLVTDHLAGAHLGLIVLFGLFDHHVREYLMDLLVLEPDYLMQCLDL
jgi:hypothetical protein